MELEVMAELAACIDLCRELENLFRQDMDEIPHSMTGEVCAEYLRSVQEAADQAAALRQRIQGLLSQHAALL